MKITAIALMIALNFITAPAHATWETQRAAAETGDIVKDNLIGGWEYTVEGAPAGYESGLIIIVKVADVYKVQVQLAGGALDGSDVVVKGNDITFKLMVEGESVSVSLSAKGSELTGKSTSSSGSYTIKGVKSISPQ